MTVRRKNASLFLGVSISFIASYMLSAPNVENLMFLHAFMLKISRAGFDFHRSDVVLSEK